jgi:hypothetical protein
MQYTIRFDDSHRVAFKPHMEVSKAGIVDEPHPVFLALLHIDTSPWHILWAFSRVGGSGTAATMTIDGADIGDWLVASSVIRLLRKGQSEDVDDDY